MKTLLSTILLLFVAITASASSIYTGDYFGIAYSNGEPVAGVDIEVFADGSITGHGAYFDFTDIKITGKVNGSGKIKIKEVSAKLHRKYTARIDGTTGSFTALLSTGNVFKGTKVSSNFRQAGIYYATADDGEDGIFILQNDHDFYGVIYDSEDEALSVEGTASATGFSGEDEDGVTFAGHFHGTSILGSYSYEGETLGSFHGYKY